MKGQTLTIEYLRRWKRNSLAVARELNYDLNALHFLQEHASVRLQPQSTNFFGEVFGACSYDSHERPIITVYDPNISTLDAAKIGAFHDLLDKRKVQAASQEKLEHMLRSILPVEFFEVFNQSGMDHELIGYAYHHHLRTSSIDKEANSVQYKFINHRIKIANSALQKAYLKQFTKLIPYLFGKPEKYPGVFRPI